ncbi:MAG: hypothetical protein JKY11_08365 [Alphaproteobacteria bacterium]|nr:hypothetical protein [Alphaproteobacteria bacterium]
MQQDKELRNRVSPPQMNHLAEQIISRSKTMDQERPSDGITGAFAWLPNFFKTPQFSYALVAACCVLLVATVIGNNMDVVQEQGSYDVAEQQDNEWAEFLFNEEEVMFAGL